MLLRQGHSFGVDWWSLGIFICEIITGFHPFQGHSHHVYTPTIINEVSSKRCKISCVIEFLLVSEMSLLCFMILWKSYWIAIPIRIRKSQSISSLVDWAVDQKEYIFIHNPWYNFLHSATCEIYNHPFFADIDWEAIYNKKIRPCFIPRLTSNTDLTFFDSSFTHVFIPIAIWWIDCSKRFHCDSSIDSHSWTTTAEDSTRTSSWKTRESNRKEKNSYSE